MIIKNGQKGSIYILVLVILTALLSIAIAAMGFVLSQAKLASQSQYKEASFHIAEAGIEYYRWHLAHDQQDFQDGTGGPGPYIHTYKDADGNEMGQFSLQISTPPSGSTVTAIISTGNTQKKPNVKKTVDVTMGRPSFTDYAVVANDDMRFGAGTEVFGPIHSNYGIRFDGLAHNIVSSSEETYTDPDSNTTEWAVHTTVAPDDPQPPTPLPQRTDVFEVGREVNAKTVSFTSISGQLDDLQAEAAANGIYLTSSGVEGYRILFKSGHKVGIYKVNSQATCQKQVCFFWWCWWTNYTSTDLWSVGTESSFDYQGVNSANLDIPADGLIFIEDDVWVEGQVNGDRVTVVAAKTPYSSGNANIITNNDLLYTNYDGTDAVGLIAQNNIYAGFYSEDDLRVDAALIAQKGRVGRLYYPESSGTFNPSGCNNYYVRNSFTNYGSIGTNQRYGYAYVCGSWPNPSCAPCGTTASGYCYRNLLYDDNFYFAPPPHFPVTDQYRIISWEEE